MTAPPQRSEASLDALEFTLAQLVEMARSLVEPGKRSILGITGAPGSGKSTLAELLATALREQAVMVGLDGFHLANSELHRLGRHARKGAADTFDAAGYVNLLKRLRARDESTVYTATFDRSLEESIACSVPVPGETSLIITEGNYLLVDNPDWAPVRELLDECWYVDPGEEVRIARLVARHEAFGRSAEEALERSLGSDQRNAELIASTRVRANRVIRFPYVAPTNTTHQEDPA